MEQDNTSNQQNTNQAAAGGENPNASSSQAAAQQTTLIDTGGAAKATEDVQMASTSQANAPANNANQTVLEQLQKEPQVPDGIQDEFYRDLWRLKILLQNHELDKMRELAELGLPTTLTDRNQQLGPYPTLPSEKRIMELCTRLWETRQETQTRSLQTPPYDAYFNPERHREQVNYLVLTYVAEHCSNFKPSAAEAENDENQEPLEEQWDPHMTKDQVIIFLQLAESLLKQVTNPGLSAKSKTDNFFKGILLFEDFEILRCSMAICLNQGQIFTDSRKEEIPATIYYPIATCPYRLFPGETRPITKLLAQEFPLKLDIDYEYETEEKDPADSSKRLKRKLVIPHSELSKIGDSGKPNQVFDFLVAYIKERQSELKIEGEAYNWPHLQQILFSICAVRSLYDDASREKCIQVWLQVMQQTKKIHVPQLEQLVGFKTKDFMEDVLHLLKTTKDELTCEQALNMLRCCDSDIEKANYLVNLEAEVPEGEVFSEDTAPTWITKSHIYRLTQQLTSMQITVTQKEAGKDEQAQQEAKPAAAEEAQVERSAFDVDMEEEDDNTGVPKATKTISKIRADWFEVTRTFSEADEDDEHVVRPELLLSSRVQIAVARLLVALTRNRITDERGRPPTQQQRFLEGIFHVRKLVRLILSPEDSHLKFSDQVRVLKYHPMAMAQLIKPCYYDVYHQSQITAFRQLEQMVFDMTEDQRNGVHLIYCDSQGRDQRDTFELDDEYKGRLIKLLLQPLGTLDLPRDRRERDGSRSPSFPARLVDSRILEQFRTNLLGSTDASTVSFVNEFLEDWVKLLVKSIDRDPALIRKLLKDKPANAQDTTEEEKKDEEQQSKPWDSKGMFPLIFERVRSSVPAKYFVYNTMLDLIKQICIVEDAKKLLEEQGKVTLEAIYDAKYELPKNVYLQDQRIFYGVNALRGDTFQSIARHIPEILETLGKHFNLTLDRVSQLSSEICQAQFHFMNQQANQSHSYQRKLRQRMEQTEQFEQLYYNVSIIQGFTATLGQQPAEVSKLIQEPSRIREVLAIFENLCLFKTFSQFNVKMGNLLKIILCDGRDPAMMRERDMQPEQQQAQLEKFKVFAARIKELTKGFVECIGCPFESMPTYDEIMAEPKAEKKVEVEASKCRFEGLTRRQEIQWFVKTISEHVTRLEKLTQLGESTRRDITLIDWTDCIQPQILFQRIMPQKELEKFHETLLQTEETFNANEYLDCQSAASHKKHVAKLRSALREKITEKDFKGLVTSLVEQRKNVDHGFKYVTESHYERYGLHLSEKHWFVRLNLIIYGAIKQTYQRHPPAQYMLDIVRTNFREQAKALATLATSVKLALPAFSLSQSTEEDLHKMLGRLSSNLVNIKPISKWARDSFRGTLLIHFVAKDGLKALTQYHVVLQELQQQMDKELGQENSGTIDALSEEKTVLVRLIANQVHDSLVLTGMILGHFVTQNPKDTKLYALVDMVQDSTVSDTEQFTTIQHFFANHYNQLLTILAQWNKDASEYDFAQILQRDTELNYTGQDSVLVLLIREMASNFPNCPMLKDNFVMDQNMPRHYGGLGGGPRGAAGLFAAMAGEIPHMGPGQRGNAGNAASEQPLREPTQDELEMIVNMGFDIELATAALQMTNFDMSRALELCLSSDQAAIRAFAERQRELKVDEEKRALEREMEMAIKMSMQVDGGGQQEEQKIEEETDVVKLIEVPKIELKDFREKVQLAVKQNIGKLLESVRSGKLTMKIDTILSLVKVALVSAPVPPPHGLHHHQPPPQAQGKPLIELTDEQQNEQKQAIFASVDEFVKVQLDANSDAVADAQVIEKLSACLLRFEFDIRLREMGYQQILQQGSKITEKTEAFAFLTSLTMAVSHIASLTSAIFQKSAAIGETEIKVHENDPESTEKAKQKAKLVELAAKMLQVSVSTIYLIHMIVINVNREHEKAIKEIVEKEKLAEGQAKHAAEWISSTNPNKIIIALQKLRDATICARAESANGANQEVKVLADQTTECVSLVATHILSLKLWHYLKVEANSEFDWFSPEWLKTTALDFAMSFLKLGKRNDKFLNQLLQLAVYEYSALPQISQNLLNVSLLYHTVYQTSSAEKKRQKDEKEQAEREGKKRPEDSKDPNQVALESFLEGKLDAGNSKVSYKNLFRIIHELHESNPLDLPVASNTLIETFKAACVFSDRPSDRHGRHATATQVAFKKVALDQVQTSVLLAAKELQDKFASMENTQKTRAQILAGELPVEQPSQPVSSEKEQPPAEEEKKSQIGTSDEQDAQMQQSNNRANLFSISEASENKKVDVDNQIARVVQIIGQVKELAQQSSIVQVINQHGKVGDQQQKPGCESTLRQQYNLMQKVSQFTQVYPDLTPQEDQFAEWVVSKWLLQLAWVEALPAKIFAKEEEKKEEKLVLLPNSNLSNDQEKVERILNRFCGLNRFQSLSQRMVRMNLRISFLEHSLVGLAGALESLFNLAQERKKKQLTGADLARIQVIRSQAVISLTVLKALISDTTNAMRNRIAVIPETFQKSIYYVLIRGRPVKDKSAGFPTPINFSKTVSALIKLSDRFLRRQTRMAAPPAEQQAENIDVSAENGSFFHGHMVSLSVGCLIDICQFIENHLHVRGQKKRQAKQPEANPAAPQMPHLAAQVQAVQQIHQNLDDAFAGLQQHLAAIDNLNDQDQAQQQPQPAQVPNLVNEIGLQINPVAGAQEANNAQAEAAVPVQAVVQPEPIVAVQQPQQPANDVDIVSDEEEDDEERDGEQNQNAAEADDRDDYDEEDVDDETSQEEDEIEMDHGGIGLDFPQVQMNVQHEYDDEEADNYGNEDDDDLYGEEMMDDDDLDDLMPDGLFQRRMNMQLNPNNQRQRDIVNDVQRQNELHGGRGGPPELWDIGMQDLEFRHRGGLNRREEQDVEETGWTQEEGHIQRALQLLRGRPLHNQAVPQGMPEREYRQNPFMQMDREHGRHREEQNNVLAEDNTSIKELTLVFQPLKATEYLKSQVEFSKEFAKQYKKTLDSLQNSFTSKKDKTQINLAQTVRSEGTHVNAAQQQSRMAFEQQRNNRIEQLQYLMQRGPHEMDIEQHINELMNQVRNIEDVRFQMENEPFVLGGGGGGGARVFSDPRHDARQGQEVDGVGAGMQSMLNQMQQEAAPPGLGRQAERQEGIMDEVLRQARGEDAGVFAAADQAEGSARNRRRSGSRNHSNERDRMLSQLARLDEAMRRGGGADPAIMRQPLPDLGQASVALERIFAPPAMPAPPQPVPPQAPGSQQNQPQPASQNAPLAAPSQPQPQLLPPNLLPPLSNVIQRRPVQPHEEDEEQALIEQALLLSMQDGGEAPQEPPVAQAQEAASSNVAMPSADSSATNVAQAVNNGEDAQEEAKQEEGGAAVAQEPNQDSEPVVAATTSSAAAQEEQKQGGDSSQQMEGVVMQNEPAAQANVAAVVLEEEAKGSEPVPPVPVVVQEVQQEISAFVLEEEQNAHASQAVAEGPQQQEQQPADQQMVVDSQDQPAAEEGKNDQQAQPEAAQNEEAKQPAAQAEEAKQPAQEAEPETFGYPNSLLIANDIEPEILGELPEEIRQAVLEPLAGQLAQHLAAVAARQAQQNQSQPGSEEQKQENANGQAMSGNAGQAPANNGIDQDYLNALPPEVRRDVIRQQEQSMAAAAQPNAAELDHAAVIATIDDPELRLDMLFNLTEAQVRALPENLRREHDVGREAQAHRIAEQDRARQRQAERQRAEERAAAERHMHHRYGHGMPPGHRGRNRGDAAEQDDYLDKVIEEVERDILERQELANYKAQAKLIERQIETEDTLIETILRLVVTQAEDRLLKGSSADASKNEGASVVTKEALENAQCSELICLIQSLDTLRHGKQSSSGQNSNRNKFANALSLLLASEVSDEGQEFKKLLLEDSEDSCDEEEEVKISADVAMEDASVDAPQTMMIDTTQNGGIAKPQDKELGSEESQVKRSASLKLALMLIGTMRVISKGFRVDLLKSLLLQDDYFAAKGSVVIQKQSDLNAKQNKTLQPPLVVILRATDSVKQNLTALETSLEVIPTESKEQRKEAQREIQQTKALLRNLNLLILDIFKEFDQVIEKILAQQTAAAAKDSTKVAKTLEISKEALVSLTQLLSLPEIEKKQLQSLGRAFLLISKQSKANWDLIHTEFQRIGETSLDKINDKLMQVSVRFQAQKPLVSKSLSVGSGLGNVEMLTGAQADEEEKKSKASPMVPSLQLRDSAQSAGKDELGLAKRQSQQPETMTLAADDKAELAKMIVQDKEALQVLKNTVVIYNFFSTEINQINAEEEKKEEAKREPAESREKRDVIKAELRQFYDSQKMLEHMTLLNDVLSILQSSDQNEMTKEVRSNISCIFEAHLPDLHEIIKKCDSSAAAVDQIQANAKHEIKMKPIVSKDSTETNSKVLSLFKNVDEDLPDRLNQFSVFCLNNKKAINKLIQKSRAQLGLQLADIVKYMPNLLDFESKREYFYKEIEKQRQAARNRGGRLNIHVHRNNILQGAYQELNYRSAAELKNKIKVTFEGEAGIDASGLTREFYIELSRSMFNPDYSLFNLTSNGVSYYANSQSYINPDHINFFKFVGRMVGKAIFDGQLLECFFARSLYKMMIGEELFFEDLSDMDNDCYRNLRWYFDNDVTDLGQYFAITRDYFGRYEEIALKEGGSNIQVNNGNKAEYIELFTFHKMYLSVKEQIDAFLGGFHEIVSRDLISVFNAKELELLISGLPNFDLADLKANTQVRGYTMDSPQVVWLFEMLESFDKHEQALFLQFVTGSSKIPLEGFRALQGMGGIDPFKVHRVRERDESALPRSHTCFNTLDLPEYPVKELMRERLLFAIKETSGFGLA